MHTDYIEKLEFNKIIDILCNYCITYIGKSIARTLYPKYQKEEVFYLLKETTEASTLIYKNNIPPFIEIANFEYIEKMLKTGSSLNITNLLSVAQILKLTNNLKQYYLNENENSSISFPVLDKYFSCLYTNPSIRI